MLCSHINNLKIRTSIHSPHLMLASNLLISLKIEFMKVIILFLTVLTASVSAMAQHAEFGIKGGLNLANIKDDAVNTTDTRTGYHIGGLVHIHLAPTWALQPELVYSLQGAEYDDGRNRLNYINIPLLLQYMHNYGFRLQTGPQLGILTDATAKRNGVNVDIEEFIKNTDFSWAFGAGYLTRSRVGIDVRYNLGISNNREGGGADFKNRVWQLGLFYHFKR